MAIPSGGSATRTGLAPGVLKSAGHALNVPVAAVIADSHTFKFGHAFELLDAVDMGVDRVPFGDMLSVPIRNV